MKTLLPALVFALAPLVAPAAVPVSATLVMDNDALTITGELSGRVMPRSGLTLPLTTTRPAGIVKEPAYRGTPYYGVIKLGDGPPRRDAFRGGSHTG